MNQQRSSPNRKEPMDAVPPEQGGTDEASEALNGYVLDPSRYPDNAANLQTTKDG